MVIVADGALAAALWVAGEYGAAGVDGAATGFVLIVDCAAPFTAVMPLHPQRDAGL